MSASRPYNWTNLIFMVCSPIAACIGVGHYLTSQHLQIGDIVAFLVMLCGTNLALTAGYHRYYSHRSYECHPALQLVYLLFGAAALQNSALQWAAKHRDHHDFVDQEGDPYSISKGLVWAHIGWTFYKEPRKRRFENVSDLRTNVLVRWQHRYILPLGIGCGFGLPGLIGWAFGQPWGGLLWGGLVRVVFVHHCTFLVNSAGHAAGPQPYSRKNSSRDSWWLSLLVFGDGYHNFHHTFPADYRGSLAWHHWDPTKWWIWSLQLCGLTWRLHRTPAQAVVHARRQSQICTTS